MIQYGDSFVSQYKKGVATQLGKMQRKSACYIQRDFLYSHTKHAFASESHGKIAFHWKRTTRVKIILLRIHYRDRVYILAHFIVAKILWNNIVLLWVSNSKYYIFVKRLNLIYTQEKKSQLFFLLFFFTLTKTRKTFLVQKKGLLCHNGANQYTIYSY